MVASCLDVWTREHRSPTLVEEPRGITRFLRRLGLPTEPPPRAPPRDEPYWQSVVMRRKAMEGQLEMFAA